MDYPDEARFLRLERQVSFLFQRLGLDPALALADDGSLPPALYDAIGRGQLIEAIKIYRQVTGASLKDAKDAVESMARR